MNAPAPGVHDWTLKELSEKEETMAAPRAIVSITRSLLNDDEYLVNDCDLENFGRELAYHRAAQNAIYNWLELPDGLEKYIDAIIAMGLGEGSRKFSATNIELAQQLFIGKRGSREYARKWITDKKKKLQNWQSFNNVLLVNVIDGTFDPKKRKNNPTTYQIYILDMILETVVEAKNDPKWMTANNRYLKNKVIRRAARKIAVKAKESPLARPAKDRSLSEEEKFDRRHRLILSSMVKNREFLNRLEIDFEDYFRFLFGETYRIATNPAGAAQLLTPSKDEADHYISVFQKIKEGDLLERVDQNTEHLEQKFDLLKSVNFDRVAYAKTAVDEEQREIKLPRIWQDGQFVEVSNNFISEEPRTSEGHIFSQSPETGCKSLITNDHRRDILSAENKPVEGTFLSGESSPPDDLSDWFNEAAGTNQPPVITTETLQTIFEGWVLRVKELIPDQSPTELWKGAWQVYLDLEFSTEKQLNAARELENIRVKVLEGTKDLTHFRAAFARWVAMGANYYQNGTSVPQSADKLARFAARLEQQLLIDDG